MILLTVDDLDRCDPLQMLAVIDSLRLFVDDEAMSSRMQMSMLMDRALLEKALIFRAKDVQMAPLKQHQRRYCQIQREKLFVCELEMPALDNAGRDEIIDRLLPLPKATEIEAGTHQQSDSNHASNPESFAMSDSEKEAKSFSDTFPPSQDEALIPKSKADHTVGTMEIYSLRKAMKTVPAHLLTPRSMRMIKIRFELARLLLKKFEVPASPDSVAHLIIRHFVTESPQIYTGGTEVERIVSHVTCDSAPLEAPN